MKDYLDEQLTFTKEEIELYCKAAGDENPEHNTSLDNILIPGLLVAAKAFGKVKGPTYLVEQTVRFSKKIYLNENVFVRRRLVSQRRMKDKMFQHISIEVFASEEVKYHGWLKIINYD